jgi:hypothetical protein
MEQLVSNQSQLGHRKCLVLIIGWSLPESFYLAPSIEDVVFHLIIVLPGCLISCLVCLRRAGCRHLHVALVYKFVCVIFFLCKESSVVSRVSGPLKAGFPLLRHT